MAYLDNSSITVDAVLTKKGREILSKNGVAFKITRFALSDDEIDYSLWNPLHPSGSDYYGKVIENMPVLEALVDETQAMRFKLISDDTALTTATTVNIPYLTVNSLNGTVPYGSSITLAQNSDQPASVTFYPATKIKGNVTQTLDTSYTFIINKSSADIINESKGMITDMSQFSTGNPYDPSGDFSSIVRQGTALQITSNVATVDASVILPITVVGNQSGATFGFLLTIAGTVYIAS